MKAQEAIAIFEELLPWFKRKDELERAFEVFKLNILEAEKKETSLFLEAAKFVSFENDYGQRILHWNDLIEELEDRNLA